MHPDIAEFYKDHRCQQNDRCANIDAGMDGRQGGGGPALGQGNSDFLHGHHEEQNESGENPCGDTEFLGKLDFRGAGEPLAAFVFHG